MPEHRRDAELEHRLYHAANVVADELSQNLVDHRGICLASDRIAELALDHVEGRLDVRSQVVSTQKLFPVVAEEVEHLLP